MNLSVNLATIIANILARTTNLYDYKYNYYYNYDVSAVIRLHCLYSNPNDNLNLNVASLTLIFDYCET